MFIHKFMNKKGRANKKTRYSFCTRGLDACMPTSMYIGHEKVCTNPNNITITIKRSSLKHVEDFDSLSPSSTLEGQLSPKASLTALAFSMAARSRICSNRNSKDCTLSRLFAEFTQVIGRQRLATKITEYNLLQ